MSHTPNSTPGSHTEHAQVEDTPRSAVIDTTELNPSDPTAIHQHPLPRPEPPEHTGTGEKGPAEQQGNGDNPLAVDHRIDETPGQTHNAGAPLLGWRAPVSGTGTDIGENGGTEMVPINFADYDVPGADLNDDVVPLTVISTPGEVAEAQLFFEEQKAAESPEKAKRARSKSRVFTAMQYQQHPETGTTMLTQEQVDAGLEAFNDRPIKYAYIWHDQDRLVLVDEGTGDCICRGLKGLHWHLVIWFQDGDDGADRRPTIRQVSDAFWIPSGRVRLPKEEAAQTGGHTHKGANAAEKAFFDFAEYLPHESRTKNAIKGVVQSERYYLTDTSQAGNPGKYQYGRGRVVANFDFSTELDAHMATRGAAAEGSASMMRRKRRLRRLVLGGMTLDEAYETDTDAFADDLPRLQQLEKFHATQQEEQRVAELDRTLGHTWTKASVGVIGPRRCGKDVFAESLLSKLQQLASHAGQQWSIATPPGNHALESVHSAELVHHQDARYYAFRSYDQMLRYLDPNQAVEAEGRHYHRGVPAPRTTVLTTSNTLEEFGMTVLSRKTTQALEEDTARGSTRAPADIDEFLLRLGWVVEVQKPARTVDDIMIAENLDKPEAFKVFSGEALIGIYRPREKSVRRTKPVVARNDAFLGQISTATDLEPVGMLRGIDRAARFLAAEVMHERSQDIIAAMPDEVAASLHGEYQLIAGELTQQVAAERELQNQYIDKAINDYKAVYQRLYPSNSPPVPRQAPGDTVVTYHSRLRGEVDQMLNLELHQRQQRAATAAV